MKIHPVSTTTNSRPLIARLKKLLTIIIVFNNFLGFFLIIPADHHADVAKGLVRRVFLIQNHGRDSRLVQLRVLLLL